MSKLHPDSAHAWNTAAQIGIVLSWSGRDDDLLNGLVGFGADQKHRTLRTFVELWEISVRARLGERDSRFDRFAAEEFESLPWDWFRLAALGVRGRGGGGLAR